MDIVTTAKKVIGDAKTYWKRPPEGRQMTFREIAAYSGGGIGAYFIITLGTACILSTGNTLISSTLGVGATDMYLLYVIAVLTNIPLTGIRANIIDNTRNKAGKYRPYIVTMAIPATIVCLLMVWFPYGALETIFGSGMTFGKPTSYVVKCAIILLCNILLNFFYYFFYDSYENLIHVLSSNSQERADVASIKSVVYSAAPTIVNLITPMIAKNVFHTNMTDIRVYRLVYPIIAVMGILLCIVVYKYTEEKIVQARTHVIQIRFIDALKEVAKNKYFWIISLAGWIGFLESSYANILSWLYNYGGVCSGNAYGIITFIYGDASLWGMLLAPFCIRRWGKKSVLVITNIFNIIFILMMLPCVSKIDNMTIWLVLGCLYLNAFMGSFAHIVNPAIQADIRDYQQYRTGERIDGMFSAVATIGTVIALATSSVLPVIYEKGGINTVQAKIVTSTPEVLNRLLGDGKTVGQLLAEQMANGQNNYINAYSALYDPNILQSLLKVLILISAFGAFLNVVPYFWYDFNEKKQKSVIRVLKIRALFEDYGNNALNDERLVEAIDLVRNAREQAQKEPIPVSKSDYKKAEDKKAAKKQYKENLLYNEEIEVSKFVCEELDKFSSVLMQKELELSKEIVAKGLEGIRGLSVAEAKKELALAKKLPKTNEVEKEYRKFRIELEKKKIASNKAVKKYFANKEFVKPDIAVLDGYFNEEDACDERLKYLYEEERSAKKVKDSGRAAELKAEIKLENKKRTEARKNSKKEMDIHAYFNRAAKLYLDAEKTVKQAENYQHYEEISALYDEAKVRAEEAKALRDAEFERLEAEDRALKEKLKAEKATKKGAKKK